MIVFTVIGMVVCAAAALALACFAGLYFHARVIRSQTVHLRKYQVVDGYCEDDERSLGSRFTFRGARRLALSQHGTRIFDCYAGTHRIADKGWYEGSNGFLGYYVAAWNAAKMLGIDPDAKQGTGRWSTVLTLLSDANVGVDWGDNGGIKYSAADVVKLARERGSDPFAFLADER